MGVIGRMVEGRRWNEGSGHDTLAQFMPINVVTQCMHRNGCERLCEKEANI